MLPLINWQELAPTTVTYFQPEFQRYPHRDGHAGLRHGAKNRDTIDGRCEYLHGDAWADKDASINRGLYDLLFGREGL